MTMTLVSTVTVGAGGAASIEFTGIPQTGTDLLVVMSTRANGSGDFLNFTLNGSSTSFTSKTLSGNGSAVYSENKTNMIGFTDGTSQTANTFASAEIYIPNYTSSVNKSWSTNSVQENNATSAWQFMLAGLWSNTAAVNSISLVLTGGNNFVQHSTASLYLVSTTGATGATVS